MQAFQLETALSLFAALREISEIHSLRYALCAYIDPLVTSMFELISCGHRFTQIHADLKKYCYEKQLSNYLKPDPIFL